LTQLNRVPVEFREKLPPKKKSRHNKNLEAKILADFGCPVSKAQISFFAPSQTFPRKKNEEQTD
jgi:hypothetical protein